MSHVSADLVQLIKSEAAVDLGPNGPERELPIGRCLTDEHVVQGEVVAYGILRKGAKLDPSFAAIQRA